MCQYAQNYGTDNQNFDFNFFCKIFEIRLGLWNSSSGVLHLAMDVIYDIYYIHGPMEY